MENDYVTKAKAAATKVELLKRMEGNKTYLLERMKSNKLDLLERVEKVETTLLKEFRKWARSLSRGVRVNELTVAGFTSA